MASLNIILFVWARIDMFERYTSGARAHASVSVSFECCFLLLLFVLFFDKLI